MTLPPGSKSITNIDFHSLYYLTGNENGVTTTNTCTSSDFNMDTGRPLRNMQNTPLIDNFFMSNLNDNLTEHGNISTNFIKKYPKVLETDSLRDIQITLETSIDAVFLYEGASMKNMFGYYFYTVDENGTKMLLDNADNSNGYYYHPTVIFPHVYNVENDQTTIQRGEYRTLKGNLPNGKFQNIYVGFFLVPHGWYALTGNGLYDDTNIFYSTVDFSRTYNNNSDEQIVKDKIYSIFAKATSEQGDELLFVGFEDVFINSVYDMDYNDCVVGFIASENSNIVDFNNYSSVKVSNNDNDPDKSNKLHESDTNILSIDEKGLKVSFNYHKYPINKGTDYVFEIVRTFSDPTYINTFYTVLENLYENYKLRNVLDLNNNTITSSFLFRSNDLKNSVEGSTFVLYLLDPRFNGSRKSNVDDFQKLLYQNHTSSFFSEKYKLYPNNSPNTKLIDITDSIDKLHIPKNNFRLTGNGVIDTLTGNKQLPVKDTAIYKIFKNAVGTRILDINIKMDVHPTGYHSNTTRYMTWISFTVNNEKLAIDLSNLDTYDGNLTKNNNLTFTNIDVGPLTANAEYVKELISALRNDSSAYFRLVTIYGYLKFYCIRFYGIKSVPTMVYLDGNIENKLNFSLASKSGTFYNKNTLYTVNNLFD